MDKFVITGGTALKGEIPTNGSKNSALPALAAALLTDEPVVLHRVPRVRDIRSGERRRAKLRHPHTRECQAERSDDCQEFASPHGNLLDRFKNVSASGRHPQPDPLTYWPSNAGM